MLQELRASKMRSVRPAIVVNKDGSGNPGYRVKLVAPASLRARRTW
jgi:hypothetical protein